MSQTTISKKACKCKICGKQINIGDKAKWFEHMRSGHGEWSGKAYSFSQWKLVCVSGCGDRLYSKEIEEKKHKELQDAKNTISAMLSMKSIKQEGVQSMIDYYNDQGIDKNELLANFCYDSTGKLIYSA